MKNRTTLTEHAYRTIKKRIVLRELGPGSTLTITDLDKQLKVDAVSVSQAIRRLANEGLVVDTAEGILVKEWTLQERLEAYHIRRALEAEAAWLFVLGASQAAKRTLVQLSNEFDQVAPRDPMDCDDVDIAIHRHIVWSTGSERLANLIEASRVENTTITGNFIDENLEDYRSKVGIHRPLVDALLGSDPDNASKIMRAHIDGFLEVLKERLGVSRNLWTDTASFQLQMISLEKDWDLYNSERCEQLHILFITSGSLCIRSAQDPKMVRPFELVLLRNNPQVCSVVAPLCGYYLQIKRDFVRQLAADSRFAPIREFLKCPNDQMAHFVLPHEDRAETEWLLKRMAWQEHTQLDRYWAPLNFYLIQFLILCCRRYPPHSYKSVRALGISADGESVIRTLLHFVDLHFAEDLNLTELAHRAGYTRCYLSTLFNKLTGRGLAEHINQRRVEKAKHLLRSTNLKIVHVCFEVGFKSLANFNRSFKRITGMSPQQYRGLPVV